MDTRVTPNEKNGSRIAAFIDIGTNSIRLLLVRVDPNHYYTILSKQKEVVRLGEGEFATATLQPEAMQRAADVCRQFTDLARSRGAEEIVAVATSATREATNQAEFLHLLETSARLKVRVISGKEEARLIYRGVASGVDLGDQQALFIDIGGGSTEVILGNNRDYSFLETHPLGAIRLTSTFFLPVETGPIDSLRYQIIKNYVRNLIVRTTQHLKEAQIDLALGSSGTITNLAEVAFLHEYGRSIDRNDTLTYAQIVRTIQMLCEFPLAERREVPGINPERADIIIAGAAILDTFMETLHIDRLLTSDRTLQDGLLMDYLDSIGHAPELSQLTVRARSVLQLGRRVNFEESHARAVARLALELFDSAHEVGLHALDGNARELLEYAALLHDIGSFLSYQNHQEHSYYLIRNADLLGFDQNEMEMMANAALYHRKGMPGKKNKEIENLEPQDRDAARILGMLLRLAENLDRSHTGAIQHVRFVPVKKKSVRLEIDTSQDCQLEIAGLRNHLDVFRKIFGKKMDLTCEGESEPATEPRIP